MPHRSTILLIAGALSILPSMAGMPAADTQTSAPAPRVEPLHPEQRIHRSIAANERQHFSLQLSPGIWRLTLEQQGVNMKAELIPEDGEVIAFDSPLNHFGTDSHLIESTEKTSWHLQIESSSNAGTYTVAVHRWVGEELAEHALALARALSRANQLNARDTTEDRRLALQWLRPFASLLAATAQPSERDSFELAELYDYLGTLARLVGEHEQSAEDHRHALAIWQRLGDVQRQARSHNGIGLAVWSLGQAAEARQHFEVALEQRRQLGESAAVVRTLNNVCLTYHAEGILPKAGACYEEALELLVGQDNLLQSEGLLRLNLGNVYQASAETDLAQQNFVRALELLRLAEDEPGEARALNHLAVLGRKVGDYDDALRYYFDALAIERRVGTVRHQARILSNIGFAYFSLGDLERAKGFFLQALPLRRQAQDRRGEAVTLGHLGIVLRQLGDTISALDHHHQALLAYQQLGDQRGEATAWFNLAESQIAADQASSALESFAAALRHLEQVGARDTEAQVHLQRAQLLLDRDDLEAAHRDIERGLELSLALRFGAGEISAHVMAAELHRRRAEPRAAVIRADQAILRIEAMRTRVASPNLRATFLASVRQAYELRIDLEMDLHALAPEDGHALRALELSERSHARSLLDLVRKDTDWRGASRVAEDGHLQRRYLAVQRRLDAKADRQLLLLRGPHDAEEARRLEIEISTALSELESLESQLQRSEPGRLAVQRPKALNGLEVQRLLDDNTVLLEFSLGDRRSFVWRIEPGCIRPYELPPRARLERDVRHVYASLSSPSSGSRLEDQSAIRDLSRVLLAPLVEPPCSASSGVEPQRLVIVSDGALNLLPFAALQLPSPDTMQEGLTQGPGKPLVEDFEISYLPSASVLAALRRSAARRRPPPLQVAVMADPVFDLQDPRWQALAQGDRVAIEAPAVMASRSDRGAPPIPFERLPASRREAQAIATIASPESSWIALDFEANRQSVFSPQLGDYRIVHFATHGWVDTRNPALSGLALSQIDQGGQPLEGLLRLHDISRLPLNADLVVLSGCQTALGREILGEGLIGLGRGFMSAGAQRVAASLWRVQDRATAELMGHFYRNMLRDGETPAAALRAAQRTIRQQRRWRHPYYWAAFVVQGDWHSTSAKESAQDE